MIDFFRSSSESIFSHCGVQLADEELVQADDDDELHQREQVGVDRLQQRHHLFVTAPLSLEEIVDEQHRSGNRPAERGHRRDQ